MVGVIMTASNNQEWLVKAHTYKMFGSSLASNIIINFKERLTVSCFVESEFIIILTVSGEYPTDVRSGGRFCGYCKKIDEI